jgi:hypothetical protein
MSMSMDLLRETCRTADALDALQAAVDRDGVAGKDYHADKAITALLLDHVLVGEISAPPHADEPTPRSRQLWSNTPTPSSPKRRHASCRSWRLNSVCRRRRTQSRHVHTTRDNDVDMFAG